MTEGDTTEEMEPEPYTIPNTDFSRTDYLLELIWREQQKSNALLTEFVQAVNKVGDMFNGSDGKPVSPMSLISGALFGKH